MKKIGWMLATGAAGALTLGFAASASAGADTARHAEASTEKPIKVEVLAPERRDNAGVEGKGWFVDLKLTFRGTPLAATGFTAPQLTGPATHNNTAPFPGTFSTGQDDRLPGLVVLSSTTNDVRPGFSGPGTNLANLFNLSGITDRSSEKTELWDTWIVGDSIAGKDVDSVLTVAVVDDLNHDGVYNDAPNVVKDVNGDGKIDARDLKAQGVASNIVTVPFHINGSAA
ncbi:hypothetical protein GCM10020367_15480 [Streptomyces sannanensis]|uniref:Dockerin domain-containing protein n=1 Tax=Streptomyces sannanensis TaxID=285536 RepID=A0ABP6S7I0_9ACTN